MPSTWSDLLPPLKILNITGCGLKDIPSGMFVNMTSLRVVDLSGNQLQTFDVDFSDNRYLSVLNLNCNRLRTISNRTMKHLSDLLVNQLAVYLVGNQLDCCDCVHNQVHPVLSWIKYSSNIVSDDQCQVAADGRQSSMDEFVLSGANPCGAVACASSKTRRLSSAAVIGIAVGCSIVGLLLFLLLLLCVCWCRITHISQLPSCRSSSHVDLSADKDVGSAYEHLDGTYDRSTQLSMQRDRPRLPRVYMSLSITNESDQSGSYYASIDSTRCEDRPIYTVTIPEQRQKHIVMLMKLVFEEASDDNDAGTAKKQDVFIYYHDDDVDWVQDVLIKFLETELKMSVKTEDHFQLGSVWLADVIDSISESEFVILVLSSSYIIDGRCREVTIRAYTLRPYAIIPIGLNITAHRLWNDSIHWGMIKTNGLLEWSEDTGKQTAFWELLRQRLGKPRMRVAGLEVDVLEVVVSKHECQIKELFSLLVDVTQRREELNSTIVTCYANTEEQRTGDSHPKHLENVLNEQEDSIKHLHKKTMELVERTQTGNGNDQSIQSLVSCDEPDGVNSIPLTSSFVRHLEAEVGVAQSPFLEEPALKVVREKKLGVANEALAEDENKPAHRDGLVYDCEDKIAETSFTEDPVVTVVEEKKLGAANVATGDDDNKPVRPDEQKLFPFPPMLKIFKHASTVLDKHRNITVGPLIAGRGEGFSCQACCVDVRSSDEARKRLLDILVTCPFTMSSRNVAFAFITATSECGFTDNEEWPTNDRTHGRVLMDLLTKEGCSRNIAVALACNAPLAQHCDCFDLNNPNRAMKRAVLKGMKVQN